MLSTNDSSSIPVNRAKEKPFPNIERNFGNLYQHVGLVSLESELILDHLALGTIGESGRAIMLQEPKFDFSKAIEMSRNNAITKSQLQNLNER